MPIRNILIILTLLAFIHGRAGNRTVCFPGSIVEPISADTVGSRVVWDFSCRSILGQCALQYIFRADSTVMELLPDFRCDYAVSGDSVSLKAVEGRTWLCLTDTLPLLPHYTGSAYGSLSLHLSRKFVVKGSVRERVTSGHTVIPAPGDTIGNVRLLTLSFCGDLTEVSADSLQRPSASGNVEAVRRYWIADGGAYPLATDWQLVLPDGSSDSRAYLFPSSCMSADGDNSDTAISPPARAAAAPYMTVVENFRPPVPKPYGPSLEESGLRVEIRDNSVTVTLGAGSETADILLCDIAGRVIEAHTGTRLQTTFSGLVPGEYLISILTGDTRSTEKIIMR